MRNKIILTNNFKTSSIVKVDNISYMPKPSYEAFPAIPLYSSNNELDWELINHVFKDNNKLNLTGVPSAGGVWSPSLSHDGKKFYLVYSVVKSFGGNNLVLDNYIMFATNIMKKWSDPVYLNSNKACSILVHHNEKCYLISLRLNIETEYEPTRAIVIQEFDKKKSTLIGEEKIIAKPVARGELFSEILFEVEEDIFKLTLVEYTNNKKYATVLTSKELESMYHVLKFVDDIDDVGEVFSNSIENLFIENIDSIDTIEDANSVVQEIVNVIMGSNDDLEPTIKFNDKKDLGVYTLHEPLSDDWFKKSKFEDAFKLSLRGRNSLSSNLEQSFIGKVVTNQNYTFKTTLHFKPENIYQSAGITCYYNNNDYYYLRFYRSEALGGLNVGVTSSLNGNKFEIIHHGIKLGDMVEKVHMKVQRNNNQIQFSYSLFSGSGWVNVSTPIDISSVEARHDGNCLVGVTVQDQNNKSVLADFYGMDYS